MRKFLGLAVVAVAFAGCMSYQRYKVNRGGDGVTAQRIDERTVSLQSKLGRSGWTFMMLERFEDGVRYTVEATFPRSDRVCRGSGYFYDTCQSDASCDLLFGESVLEVTGEVMLFIERWNEVIRSCR